MPVYPGALPVYLPLIRTFPASKLMGSGFPQSLKALTVRDFVIAETHNRSAEYVRLLATAVRSFCRFLFLAGHMPVDLSPSVPRVCKYHQSTPPAFLAPEEVTRVLAAMNRFVVRGKGRTVERLPLLRDIGEALAAYLHKDRDLSKSRRIFLRMWAPRIGLRGPTAVGHIVRLALARAGNLPVRARNRPSVPPRLSNADDSPWRLSAGDCRSSSPSLTNDDIGYTQVAFEALREVAQRWPARGGAR